MRPPYLRDAAPRCCHPRPGTLGTCRSSPGLIAEEIRGCNDATRRVRRKAAGLPAGKTFESCANTTTPRTHPDRPATLEGVGRAENLAIAGPPGTGKTQFIEARAHKVIDAGLLSWFTPESLTTAIGRANADGFVAKTIAKITRAELIRDRRHRHAACRDKLPVRRQTASSTPPTNAAASRSPATCTRWD